jgi:multidrug efflux pump
MNSMIDACLNRRSALMLLLVMLLWTGGRAYHNIPKERDPDISFPYVHVHIPFDGIAPEDAERLLVRPLEINVRTISGVKNVRGTAGLHYGGVGIEFEVGVDLDEALREVREKVGETKPKWPQGTKEPEIMEFSTSLFPVINVLLHGNISERELMRVARDLKNKLEEITSVLKVEPVGVRDMAMEIIVDPMVLAGYGLNLQTFSATLTESNRVVAGGQLQRPDGTYTIKLQGLLEKPMDFLNFPVKVVGDKVIVLGDIAEVRNSFEDPGNYARLDGHSAVALEVSKRSGRNLFATIQSVKQVVEREKKHFPKGLMVTYGQDTSTDMWDMLHELENTILLAVILAMIPIVLTMGGRSAFLVALAIPGSFMFAMNMLYISGMSLNMVVLFSLILCVGMLVDAAIVVCEYADRKMVGGMAAAEAYRYAAKRMCWPVIAGVATHIIVFVPLLFWPDVIGKFMLYMPITVILTMSGSLLMAFFLLPALGSYLGTPKRFRPEIVAAMHASEVGGDLRKLTGLARPYAALLRKVLDYPVWCIGLITSAMILVMILFGTIGPGQEFFPNIEPGNAKVILHAQGNLSLQQKDALVKEVEARILDMDEEVRVFYAKSYQQASGDAGADTIGEVQMEFQNWKVRRKASAILQDMRTRLASLYGVTIEIQEEKGGPSSGKPIQIQLRSRDVDKLSASGNIVMAYMKTLPALVDIASDAAVPEIEWQLLFDRALAARYGVSIHGLEQQLQLFTDGLVITTIRPDASDKEVNVRVRMREEKRTLSQLMQTSIVTAKGNVPISNFVKFKAKPKQGAIHRLNGERLLTLEANVKPGVLADNEVKQIQAWLHDHPIDSNVSLRFAGQQEEQDDAAAFLSTAFGLAIFMMAWMMVVQFNSIYKMFVIMTSVFLSTGGVLFVLLVTHQPFGIVMSGIGVIALAGTIVNNNIIFIDMFDELQLSRQPLKDVLIRTGVQRLRPILLTAGTAVLGLLPMVLGVGIDFVNQEVTFDAPSGQWWRQLSSAIASGLTFATVLTLFYTPCLLLVGDRVGAWWKQLKWTSLRAT